MANRYWVGSSGNWSDSTNHWSTTSGGSPAALQVPTFTDDVFIDSNSGLGAGGTITLDVANPTMHDITCTSGHSYTLAKSGSGSGPQIYGSAEFEAGITWPNTFGVAFKATDTGHTVKTNGMVFGKAVNFYGEGGSWTLLDNLTTNDMFDVWAGTFDANDFNITARTIYFEIWEDNTEVYMGSGTWTCTGNVPSNWGTPYTFEGESAVVIHAETSTIKFTDATSDTKIFKGDGNTFYNLWLSGAGTGDFIIWNSNTFNDFKVDTPPHTVKFEEGTTQTVSTWNVLGTTGNLITTDSIRITPTYIPSGVELVENGSFNGNANGWNLGNLWAYDTNKITANNANGDTAYQSISIFPNQLYIVSFDVIGGTQGDLALILGGRFSPWIPFGSAHYDIEITSASASINISFGGLNGFNGSIDNISVQEEVAAPAIQHTLSKSSGVVSCDYLNISNSNATGGATWYAGNNSADTTNNDGWIFTGIPSPSLSPSASISPSQSPSVSSSVSPSESPSESSSISPSSSESPSVSPSESPSLSPSSSQSPSLSPSASQSPSLSPSQSPSESPSLSPSSSESPSLSPSSSQSPSQSPSLSSSSSQSPSQSPSISPSLSPSSSESASISPSPSPEYGYHPIVTVSREISPRIGIKINPVSFKVSGKTTVNARVTKILVSIRMK